MQPRLAALGADMGEAFWNAIRANLVLLAGRAANGRAIVDGPIEPVVAGRRVRHRGRRSAAALAPMTATTWQAFTNAVKEETGAKGKALFMPLRQALTGMDHGPEMAALFPLIGEARARKRLERQAA